MQQTALMDLEAFFHSILAPPNVAQRMKEKT
jgi:hypothetical protein